MAVTVTDATTYITAQCVDVDDWTDSDEAKKLRMLNVAQRTLSATYPTYTIPDAAIFEFTNVLAIVFNDTNRQAQQGMTSFSIDKVGSFNFKDSIVGRPSDDLRKFIPQTSRDIIGTENGVKLPSRRVAWSVM